MSLQSAELNQHFDTEYTHTDSFHDELQPKIAEVAAQYGLPIDRLTRALYGRWEAQLTARQDVSKIGAEVGKAPESLANLGFEMALLASIQKHGEEYQNGVSTLQTKQASAIQTIMDGSITQAV